MGHLPLIDWHQKQGVICRPQLRSTRPFSQNCKKADNVLGYLPGILIGKGASDTRLPDGVRLLD
jgi:hypothetical protein